MGTEEWKTGARIGRYEILSKIASGGMATVFLGRAHGAAGFERLVALKLCHPHLLEDGQAVERFLAEARLAARIHHPNVVATLDVVNEPTLCIAMEYVEGGSLSSLIMAARERDARIPPPICLRIATDLLSGLHAAHSLTGSSGSALNLVHRDVTPQNVLVGVDGVARIADFGILKIEGQPQHTAAGNVRGKLPYLAPEQFDPAPPTRQVDVHAAGVVLWEALAGARLFSGSDYDVADQICNQPRPSVREEVPELPVELEQVVARALARDRGERFATAAEFAEALEKLPVPVASAREVAAFVSELLAGQLEERRRALQHATAEITMPGALSPEPARAPTTPDRPKALVHEEPSTTVEAPTPSTFLPTAVVPVARRDDDATAVSRRSPSWWLAVPALVAAALLAWLNFPRAKDTSPAVRTAPAEEIVAPQSNAPPPAATPVAAPEPPKAVEPPHEETPPPSPARHVPAAEAAHHAAPRPHHKPKAASHPAKANEHAAGKPAQFDPDSL